MNDIKNMIASTVMALMLVTIPMASVICIMSDDLRYSPRGFFNYIITIIEFFYLARKIYKEDG